MKTIFEQIFDSFKAGKADYKFIMDNLDAVREVKDYLVNEFNSIIDEGEESDNIMPILVLLTLIDAKEIFPALSDVFNLSQTKLMNMLGDLVYEIMPYSLNYTFNGDYSLFEETLLNKKRHYFERSVLFEAYADVCIKNKKTSRLINFIKANLEDELFENYYDSITTVYLNHKLDSLTVVVKELNLKGKLDVMTNGPYFEILDDYLLDPKKDESSKEFMFAHLKNFIQIDNLPENDMVYDGYYEHSDAVRDKIAFYVLNNKYNGDINAYVNALAKYVGFESLYPKEEIKNEITTVEKDIDIDYELYQYVLTADVILADEEFAECEEFLEDFYNAVIDNFEDYLKKGNFTYDDYDNSRSIHFVTRDLYEEE